MGKICEGSGSFKENSNMFICSCYRHFNHVFKIIANWLNLYTWPWWQFAWDKVANWRLPLSNTVCQLWNTIWLAAFSMLSLKPQPYTILELWSPHMQKVANLPVSLFLYPTQVVGICIYTSPTYTNIRSTTTIYIPQPRTSNRRVILFCHSVGWILILLEMITRENRLVTVAFSAELPLNTWW